jgi:hypothetical protein
MLQVEYSDNIKMSFAIGMRREGGLRSARCVVAWLTGGGLRGEYDRTARPDEVERATSTLQPDAERTRSLRLSSFGGAARSFILTKPRTRSAGIKVSLRFLSS